MKTICDILSEQALFKDLTSEQIQALAEHARYRRYQPKELLFRNGELASRYFVVLSGKVLLEAPTADGQSVSLQSVGAGELLGWSWNGAEGIQMRARALETTTAIYFRASRLREQCEQDHTLGYVLFQRVAERLMQRLQTTRQLLLELCAPSQGPKPE